MSDSEGNLRERVKKLRKRIEDGELDRETVRRRLRELLPAACTRKRKCCCSCLTVLIFFASFCTLAYFHKTTRLFLKRNVAVHSYPVLRKIRLFLIPYIQDGTFQWESVYDADCMINNPYFDKHNEWEGRGNGKSEESMAHIRGITELDEMSVEGIQKMLLSGHPVVVRRVSSVSNITYNNMRDFMNSHWENVSVEICEFQKQKEVGGPDNFVSEIFESESDPCGLVGKDAQHWSASWKHCSQEMILSFVRLPEFVLAMGEVSRSSYIYCSCPFSEQDFDLEMSGDKLIVQLTGAKRFTIYSDNCMTCPSFGITLKAGDIMIYGTGNWRHVGLPQGEGTCTTYMTSIELFDIH